MATACSGMMTFTVSPLVALSVASSSPSSSSSTSCVSASFSVNLPKNYNGLSRSLPSRLLASRSASLFLKKKLHLSSSTNSGAAKTSVVSTSSDLPLVGNIAPNFEAEAVFDQEFVKIKLSDYIGKKYVIVFFYPLDFTFVCPTEITAFSDKYPEFEKLNTEVIGVSTDSVFSHLAWIQSDRKSGGLGDLKYPLVSDLTKKISKAYSVLIADQKPTEPMPGDVPLVGGIPKPVVQTEPTKSFDERTQRLKRPSNVFDIYKGIALRGLFIIDKEGIIQHATINNLSIGRSVDETLRTLQAVQYVQENPDEVCPAGWKPGEKTMKQDLKLSKEYFAAI